MKKYNQIGVTGSISYDEIMDFPGQFVDYFHPEKLHQLNVSFVVDKLEKQIGGIATNIAYNLSFMTTKRIIPFGGVGKDGSPVLEFFNNNKIETTGILFSDDLYTATGKVITDKKDNQIWGYYYGALILGQDVDITKYLSQDSMIIISPTHPKAFLHFQEQSIKNNIDYMYDPGMGLSVIPKESVAEGVRHCKWLIGNDYEIAMIERLTKIKINDILAQGTAVITTLGEEGVRYKDRDNEYYIPAVKVEKVVDPTGAGDAWRGGFIGGMVEGKFLKECLIQGNVLASFAVEKYGTVKHKPTKEQIDQRIKRLSDNLIVNKETKSSKTQISKQA